MCGLLESGYPNNLVNTLPPAANAKPKTNPMSSKATQKRSDGYWYGIMLVSS